MDTAQQKTGGLSVELSGPEVLVRAEGVVEAEVDGERVLLSPKGFTYFGLSGSGAPVWDRIDGSTSLDAVVAALEGEYDADPSVIRRETQEFTEALIAAGLVEVGGE